MDQRLNRDDSVNTLISMFWALATNTGMDVWFERGPTELNPSNEISRGKWDVVKQQWWTSTRPPLTKSLIIRLSSDIEYAINVAALSIPRSLQRQSPTTSGVAGL